MGKKSRKNSQFLNEIQSLGEHNAHRPSFGKRDPNRMQKEAKARGIKVIPNPTNVKISDCIFQLIEPYLESDSTDDLHMYIVLGVIAWNASLLPEEKRAASIHHLLVALTKIDDPILLGPIRQMINDMVADKLEHFGDICMVIQDYEINEVHGELRLQVIATLPEDWSPDNT